MKAPCAVETAKKKEQILSKQKTCARVRHAEIASQYRQDRLQLVSEQEREH